MHARVVKVRALNLFVASAAPTAYSAVGAELQCRPQELRICWTIKTKSLRLLVQEVGAKVKDPNI